jgi:NAD(P)-dependent dehydrogenase (short-subunit alcohol dehydrogenase family)
MTAWSVGPRRTLINHTHEEPARRLPMSRTVLITGAGGNIGTKLRAHFSSLGWTLRLLDADARGDAAIQAADLAEWDDAWVTQFAGVDTVIHLAGNPSPAASWASALRLNIDLTGKCIRSGCGAGRTARGVRQFQLGDGRPSSR